MNLATSVLETVRADPEPDERSKYEAVSFVMLYDFVENCTDLPFDKLRANGSLS